MTFHKLCPLTLREHYSILTITMANQRSKSLKMKFHTLCQAQQKILLMVGRTGTASVTPISAISSNSVNRVIGRRVKILHNLFSS